MGVEAVISGLDPNIAMTLIEMGMDLEGVKTYLHLVAAYEAVGHHGHEAVDAAEDDEGWWWR
jgi:hypothetical protein